MSFQIVQYSQFNVYINHALKKTNVFLAENIFKKNCLVGNTLSFEIVPGAWESRFGFAIANLGDVNRDGYEDIAIGAPYDGDGVVYIYLGSKNGLIEKVSQVTRRLFIS